MKVFAKIIISTFFIFNLVSVYTANAQGFSSNKIEISNLSFDYDVLIYPNPVTDNKFYVKSEKVIKSIEVLNVLGQNIKTVNNETNVAYNIFVELGQVKKGMYMVKITFIDRNSIIRKIIVK